MWTAPAEHRLNGRRGASSGPITVWRRARRCRRETMTRLRFAVRPSDRLLADLSASLAKPGRVAGSPAAADVSGC